MDLVAFLLQDAIEDWWTLEEQKHVGELSWDYFKEAFNKLFYTETYREEKHNEFLHLMQSGKV